MNGGGDGLEIGVAWSLDENYVFVGGIMQGRVRRGGNISKN
jgi:hypothetical protein